jgi:hypothetical protein
MISTTFRFCHNEERTQPKIQYSQKVTFQFQYPRRRRRRSSCHCVVGHIDKKLKKIAQGDCSRRSSRKMFKKELKKNKDF